MDSDPVKSEFIQAMRGITSTVTVVSAKSGSSQQAMTATSVASLSLEPPSMLVCINHEASIHQVMDKGLGFCINVLTIGQQNVAEVCSHKEKEDQRFLEGNWSVLEGIPYNTDSQSNLFCQCVDTIRHKSHTVYIGEITKVINKNISEPLLYKDGNYLD
jgi:flavin reductase (DIM6/NTAB) family NADH-FMN oxidoreductase RutF